MFTDADAYSAALHIAAKAHSNQKTPNGLPYLAHVTAVAAEVMAAKDDFEDNYTGCMCHNSAIVAALWHDILEDTSMNLSANAVLPSAEKLWLLPVGAILKAVEALTKNESLPKRERMADSLDRIVGLNWPWVGIVKMCDRIVNLNPLTIPHYWSEETRRTYRDEGVMIYERLRHCGSYTGNRLKKKIDAYPI